ncbi:MAG: bifunctional hydroxymethylpyrimidine kinase/phosphomethylpyrimidine kinase [Spirochaetales bacterium]|nr:bifunctional hydroxymethylpyrimidine kinase/phosphomethylpyrimidine kinase [Spirochaetales bacterium]
MKTALTIAGSDCSGGAGIQADIKTMTMCGVYAMSAITALTAQNTTGVFGIMEVTPDFLATQIDVIAGDIPPNAVKTGMVSSIGLIEVIADKIKQHSMPNVVVDPVMVSTSGARLISEDAVAALESRLFPLATVITPNIPEAEVISGSRIQSKSDMEQAAKIIHERFGCAVLLKGGHSIADADDYLYQNEHAYKWFTGKRIDNPNTHGTGCTLSSAIASYLALEHDLIESVGMAKDYLSGALAAGLDLGKGSGPMMHNYLIHNS